MRIEIKLQAAFLIHALYYHKIIFLKYKSNYGAHLFIKTFSLTQCLLKKFHTPFPAVYSLQPTFPDSQATIPLSYLDRTVWTNIASTSYLLCPTQRQLVTLYMFCSLCIYSLRVTILYYIHFFFLVCLALTFSDCDQLEDQHYISLLHYISHRYITQHLVYSIYPINICCMKKPDIPTLGKTKI